MRKNTQLSEEALTRREREIMDIVYAAEEASARHVWERLPSAPSYSTVRTLLGVLEEKGHLVRRQAGKALLYRPARHRAQAAAGALRRLLTTFFHGSVERAVAGLLELEDPNLTPGELDRVARLVNQARKEKKP
ncbi:MAG TPA: BlaI/MecI/CopY family transcriptional regulator [Chthoniobacteraceae bacterium]|jgi:predicted transcriptional regulator